MPDVRYADLVMSPPAQLVQTMGAIFGPPLGDNWQQLAALPQASMPSGARPYVFIVQGTIGNVQLAGTFPFRGVLQLCLGTTAGLKHENFRVGVSARVALDATQGVPFQFVVFVNSTFSDVLLGSTFNPAGSQLCLWARTFLNGDAQTYAVQFTVADVSWLWFDISTIPGASVSMDQQDFIASGGTALGTTVPTSFNKLGSSFGADGQTWLNFANVWCISQEFNQAIPANAPRFHFGHTPDGTYPSFVKKIGSVDRWGMQHAQVSQVGFATRTQWQHGGFWVHQGAQQAGFSAYELPIVTNRTLLFRYRHFALRLDQLPDVRFRSDPGPNPMGVNGSVVSGGQPAWQNHTLTLERPTPNPLILSPTLPIVMIHGVMRAPAPTVYSYGARVFEQAFDGMAQGATNCFPIAVAVRGEAVSSMAFTRRGFQTTSPVMQFKGAMIGGSSSLGVAAEVVDFCMVTWHPIQDPSPKTTPGAVPAPLLLVPGKQSPDPGSLSPPPHAPSGDPLERGNLERNEIRGGTGYARGWPMGAKALRVLTVNWGPLSETDAAAVFTFLRDTPAWRYTPPRSPSLAVLSISRPELSPASHRTATITVDVAVLVWTGA